MMPVPVANGTVPPVFPVGYLIDYVRVWELSGDHIFRSGFDTDLSP